MENTGHKSRSLFVVMIVVTVAAALAVVYYVLNLPGATLERKPAGNSDGKLTAARDAPRLAAGAQPPNALGSPDALVTVEAFADFQCSECSAAQANIKEIQRAYGDKVRFVFRNFPLETHDKAYDAALAAEAAGMQGAEKFWAVNSLLFVNQKSWTDAPNYIQIFAGYAKQSGVNVAKFQLDVAGLAAKSRVDLDLERGRSLGVTSTPTVFVNGQPVPYPEVNIQGLRDLIDSELERTQAAADRSTPAPIESPGSR